MARLPLQGSKMNKIKFGTTVDATTPNRIGELRSKNPEEIRSTGEAIDYLCVMLTGLTPRVAKAMDEACSKELWRATREMKTLSPDGSEEFSGTEIERSREQLLRLHKHFSLYYKAQGSPRNMRWVSLPTTILPSFHPLGY